MAMPVDLEKIFVRANGVVDLSAELEGQDRVLSAMDDEDGRGDLLQKRSRVELGANEEAQAGKKPIDFASYAGCGGERRFEHKTADRMVSG